MRDSLQGKYGLHQGIAGQLEGTDAQAKRIFSSNKEATTEER
jgi:hypothetical protein